MVRSVFIVDHYRLVASYCRRPSIASKSTFIASVHSQRQNPNISQPRIFRQNLSSLMPKPFIPTFSIVSRHTSNAISRDQTQTGYHLSRPPATRCDRLGHDVVPSILLRLEALSRCSSCPWLLLPVVAQPQPCLCPHYTSILTCNSPLCKFQMDHSILYSGGTYIGR